MVSVSANLACVEDRIPFAAEDVLAAAHHDREPTGHLQTVNPARNQLRPVPTIASAKAVERINPGSLKQKRVGVRSQQPRNDQLRERSAWKARWFGHRQTLVNRGFVQGQSCRRCTRDAVGNRNRRVLRQYLALNNTVYSHRRTFIIMQCSWPDVGPPALDVRRLKQSNINRKTVKIPQRRVREVGVAG